jgi:hypothetical protein
MVRVVNYHVRQTKDGKPFVALELQGDLVMVQSMETGRFYATAKKCTITSTFNEEVAKTLIGEQIPGRIERVACDPFDFTVPESGEVITLNHRWEYFPDGVPAPIIEMHSVNQELVA